MKITFDPVKNARNIAERGLSFERAEKLDWDGAVIRPDIRHDYGEMRFRVLAMLENRLHAAVITPRRDSFRIVSFRKANARERKYYEKEKAKSLLN